ncbi:hypothetical protein [Delftia tsuruhatensis]|uniref:hypothetical protein n=1 Tax=Delftia tsuruhatensis TaxID=180282 RepID=UPI00289BF772|nr:hypothetical protein [Delftia tsuruhatensis]
MTENTSKDAKEVKNTVPKDAKPTARELDLGQRVALELVKAGLNNSSFQPPKAKAGDGPITTGQVHGMYLAALYNATLDGLRSK